jgi:hypothetical protein
MIHGVQRRPSHAPTSSETPAPASFDAISSRLGGTPARSSALRTAAAHSALLDTIRMLVRCAFATSSLAARATRPCSSDARTHASVTRKSSAGHPSVPRSERSSPLRTHMSHGSGRSPSSGATADAVAGDDCREGAEAQPTARSVCGRVPPLPAPQEPPSIDTVVHMPATQARRCSGSGHPPVQGPKGSIAHSSAASKRAAAARFTGTPSPGQEQ